MGFLLYSINKYGPKMEFASRCFWCCVFSQLVLSCCNVIVFIAVDIIDSSKSMNILYGGLGQSIAIWSLASVFALFYFYFHAKAYPKIW